ncbi:epidermal growth factor receptor substrate 15-like 1, partial [Octopus bimaculoides]|uniref:epidermal growth factor receptor substrate 15-like 1 n=1 Tax=Octopus bimaculoides TaxID=37653 RepID=UPI0022E0DAE0
LQLLSKLFTFQADPTNTGSIGALDAARFLKKSSLKENVLSQIWDLSDPTGKGYLEKPGFFIALKLIALAQIGHEISLGRLPSETPPPNLGPVEPVLSPPETVVMSPPHSVGTNWVILPPEKAKYDKLFDSLQPVNGLASGDKVKPVLLNSKLPVDILGHIWDLSDVDKDGFLDKDEFAVAMHLVYSALENNPVPTTLPPKLIPPSKRKRVSLPGGTITDSLQPRTDSPAVRIFFIYSFSDLLSCLFKLSLFIIIPYVTYIYICVCVCVCVCEDPLIPTHFFLAPFYFLSSLSVGEHRLETSRSFSNFSGHQTNQTNTPACGLFPHLNELYDPLFTSPSYCRSLCDIKSTGKLNAEQFALAMYLMGEKKKGATLPQQLTPEMVPPTMRSQTNAGPAAFGVMEGDSDPQNQNPATDLSGTEHSNTELTNGAIQEQEEELNSLRADLNNLRDEEAHLEAEVAEKKVYIETLLKNQKDTQRRSHTHTHFLIQFPLSSTLQAKTRIQHLQDQQRGNNSNAQINGEFAYFPTSSSDGDQFSTLATAGSSPISIGAFSHGSSMDDFRDDPFKSKDPFSNTAPDPFQNDDPF